jgi:amino acid transporter
MDITRLRQGERIAALSAIALILIMFIFTWFDTRYGGVLDVSGNAWQSYGVTDIVLFLTALAALGLAYLAATKQALNLPVAASAIVVGLGALSLILILWSLIFSTPDVGSQGLVSGSTSRDIGVWLGLIATGALTYGAYLAMQEEGATYGGRGERQRRPRGERPRREPPPPSAPGP